MWLAPIGWIRTKLRERRERDMIEKFTRGYDWATTFLNATLDKEGAIESISSRLAGAKAFGSVDPFDRGVEAAIGDYQAKLKPVAVCKHHWVPDFKIPLFIPKPLSFLYVFRCAKCDTIKALYKGTT